MELYNSTLCVEKGKLEILVNDIKGHHKFYTQTNYHLVLSRIIRILNFAKSQKFISVLYFFIRLQRMSSTKIRNRQRKGKA